MNKISNNCSFFLVYPASIWVHSPKEELPEKCLPLMMMSFCSLMYLLIVGDWADSQRWKGRLFIRHVSSCCAKLVGSQNLNHIKYKKISFLDPDQFFLISLKRTNWAKVNMCTCEAIHGQGEEWGTQPGMKQYFCLPPSEVSEASRAGFATKIWPLNIG